MKIYGVPLLFSLALLSSGAGLLCCSSVPPGNLICAALAQEANEKTKADAKRELPPCLADIAKATVVEDGALRSCKLKDSLLAAQKLGPAAKDMLIEMSHTATPAGRLLSLALLRKIDATEYQKQADALNQELGAQSVSYISPSERCHYSVSDILSDQASKTPLIKLLPVPASK